MSGHSPDNMGIVPLPEILESLAASFDRVLHVEGEFER